MIKNFFKILTDCTACLSGKEWFVVLLVALLLGAGCWFVCSYYTKLWNKNFKIKAQHHILCGMAMIFSVFFIIYFYAIKYIEPIACHKIEVWHENILEDNEWASNTFEIAFYAVKKMDPESFSNVPEPEEEGSYIPFRGIEEQKTCVEIYIEEAYTNFFEHNRFLGKMLHSQYGVPEDIVIEDIQNYFATHHGFYPSERAIDLTANYIKEDLIIQTPRIVRITRFILIILFLIVQLIPFGLIGYYAYKDLKLQKFPYNNI